MDLAPGAGPAGPLRPRGIWYVVAALIAAGGVLAAAAVLLAGPLGGGLGQRLTPGTAVAVHVPEAGKVVWTTSTDLNAADVDCQPSLGNNQEPSGWSTQSLRQDGLTMDVEGQRWHGALLVMAEPAGVYSMMCTLPQATGGAALAVGDPPRFYGSLHHASAVVGAALLAVVGLALGSALAVLIAVRRGRALRRSVF